MNRTVAFAIIIVMNAILALVMATTLTNGSGTGVISRSLFEHTSAASHSSDSPTGASFSFPGLSLNGHD